MAVLHQQGWSHRVRFNDAGLRSHHTSSASRRHQAMARRQTRSRHYVSHRLALHLPARDERIATLQRLRCCAHPWRLGFIALDRDEPQHHFGLSEAFVAHRMITFDGAVRERHKHDSTSA